MDVSADLVRRAGRSSDVPPSDPVLVERIRDEIRSSGPMTFARFMGIALYDPERGYYRTGRSTAGRDGDYLTAPEAHPIFGAAIARQLDECWQRLGRPRPFTVREYGAGRGALAAAIVAGLRAEESPLLEALRYQPVELNEHRRAELRRRLADADAADHLAEPTEAAFTGAVIANEFLDALPVHRVEWRAGGLLEVHVDWEEDGPVDRLGPPSSAALAARLAAEGVTLEEGQRAEICLALDGWVAEVGAVLKRGYVLVIDYGHPASELYASRRRAGTLLAYREHGVEEDPYGAIGHQDLTSHVDLTALERAAAAHGLAALGSTSQAEFLVGIGAADILARWRADPAASLAGYAELRAALRRMLDPRVTGGFRVVAFGRRVPAEPALAGFGFAIDPGARGSARRSER